MSVLFTLSNFNLKPRSVGAGPWTPSWRLCMPQSRGHRRAAGVGPGSHHRGHPTCKGKRATAERGPPGPAGADWEMLAPQYWFVFCVLLCHHQSAMTCSDPKGIPLADKTLKTAKHPGPGNCVCVVCVCGVCVFNAFAFSLWTLLIVCSY